MSSDTTAAKIASMAARASGVTYANSTGPFPCGHEKTPANTRTIEATGRVRCRECVRRYMRESMARVRTKARELEE